MKKAAFNKYIIKIIRFLYRNLIYNSKKPKRSILNLIALLYLFIILFPYPFFQNKYTVNNFTIYSSNEIKSDELKRVIANSEALLSNSMIYNSKMNNKLFICNNKKLYMLFNPLRFNNSFGINSPFGDYTYLSRTDFSNNKITTYNKENNSRDISSVITHEVMHTHSVKYVGIFKHIVTKTWKKEGYCEYIATNSSFDIDTGFDLIKAGKVDKSSSFKYFRYRLYVTYLLDIKGIDLDALFETKYNINQLDEEVKANIESLEKIIKN